MASLAACPHTDVVGKVANALVEKAAPEHARRFLPERQASQCSTAAGDVPSPASARSDFDWDCVSDPGNECSTAISSADLQAGSPISASLRLLAGVSQIPHPEKEHYGGEDSFFVSPDGAAVGVADGVSEWGWHFGVNPRDFSSELMAHTCQAACEQAGRDDAAAERAASALARGFAATTAFGAATACVAVLDARASELGVANLGDSGLRLLRRAADGRSLSVALRTTEQLHAVNQPFQLSGVPTSKDFPRLRAEGKGNLVQAAKRCAARKLDKPSAADLYSFEVLSGDVVVLGSDGLFDNLRDSEICSIAAQFVVGSENASPDPELLAGALARAAAARSTGGCVGCSACAASAGEGGCENSGHLDDITVLVACVAESA